MRVQKGRIILVTGGNRRAVGNYTARSLADLESYPTSPFWLALLSPSERLLYRISSAFKFDPRVVRACLSRHRQSSCEDFGDYLFIQTSLLRTVQTKPLHPAGHKDYSKQGVLDYPP